MRQKQGGCESQRRQQTADWEVRADRTAWVTTHFLKSEANKTSKMD